MAQPWHWFDPITENITFGHREVWEIYNVAEDTHPIHLHLVSASVLPEKCPSLEKQKRERDAILTTRYLWRSRQCPLRGLNRVSEGILPLKGTDEPPPKKLQSAKFRAGSAPITGNA